MANTYSQINIQCVFAVKGRENVIDKILERNCGNTCQGF
jgi:hypothetical protein